MPAMKVTEHVGFASELFDLDAQVDLLPEGCVATAGDPPKWGHWKVTVEFEPHEAADGE